MSDFTGRYAVVTGAAKGIGRAIAERLLRDNVKGLAILDWNEEMIKATAAELDPTGERVMAVSCDVSDADSVHTAFEAIFARFPQGEREEAPQGQGKRRSRDARDLPSKRAGYEADSRGSRVRRRLREAGRSIA